MRTEKVDCIVSVTPIRVATSSSAKFIKRYDLTKDIRSDVYSELDGSLYGNIQWNLDITLNGLRDLQNVLVLTSFRYIKVLSKYFS